MLRKLLCKGGSLDGRTVMVGRGAVAITSPTIGGKDRYEPQDPPEVDEGGREVWVLVQPAPGGDHVVRDMGAEPVSREQLDAFDMPAGDQPTMTPEQRERFEAQR